MAFEAAEFFLLTGACAEPSLRPTPGPSLRCWRLGSAALCCESARHCTDALRWLAVTAAALMLATGTTVDKYLIVFFFVLQAPSSGNFWTSIIFRGHYGPWIASAMDLVRFVYYFFLGGLGRDVPARLLVVIAATPFQAMDLRESQGRAVLSLVIAAYLTIQHFTGAGGLRAFGREAIVATLSIVCMTVITLMLVF